MPDNGYGGCMRSYRLEDRLGAGGFGEVYRAELLGDGGFRKPVAIKLLHAHLAERPGHLERLRDEARVLGLLRHPGLVGIDGLVRVHSAGTAHWAMVLELVDGPPLDTLVNDVGPLPHAVVLQIGRELAAALDAAHNAVIDGRPLALVHRDVKPSNVHLGPDGRVKLLDFGIAVASFDAREARTAAGGVLGTPHYMAPERLIGDDGPESDLFALGATLATLLTGRLPAPAELGSSNHEARITRLLDGVPGDWTERLQPLLTYLPSERPTAAEVERRFARDLALAATDVRSWCRAHVKAPSTGPGHLSGTQLTEGPVPADSIAPAPLDPPPPSVSRVPRPPRPRRARRISLAWVLLPLVLIGMGGIGLFGGGSLLLVVGAAYPNGFAIGCVVELDERITELQGVSGPGQERAVHAALGYRDACEAKHVGLMDTVWFVKGVEDAVDDGVLDHADADELERLLDSATASAVHSRQATDHGGR